MNIYSLVFKDLKSFKNLEKEKVFKRFFKTEKGEYGYGDKFWGITVSNIRSVAKKYYREITFEEIVRLIEDEIHEVRLTGYIILTYKFEKANHKGREEIFEFYINNLSGCNNWDIVDLSCSKIVGNYLIEDISKRDVLYKFVKSKNLWEQRISIVSTYSFIHNNDFEDTLKISRFLLNHKHDLIHKAVGWMLREVGKRDLETLRGFLKENVKDIPRTTLRYAIEKMNEEERRNYLSM